MFSTPISILPFRILGMLSVPLLKELGQRHLLISDCLVPKSQGQPPFGWLKTLRINSGINFRHPKGGAARILEPSTVGEYYCPSYFNWRISLILSNLGSISVHLYEIIWIPISHFFSICFLSFYIPKSDLFPFHFQACIITTKSPNDVFVWFFCRIYIYIYMCLSKLMFCWNYPKNHIRTQNPRILVGSTSDLIPRCAACQVEASCEKLTEELKENGSNLEVPKIGRLRSIWVLNQK